MRTTHAAPPASILEGEAQARRLALSNYENFSVASRLLSSRIRQDLFNIYAFCRLADDFADEKADRPEALKALDSWQELLDQAVSNGTDDPLFAAISSTIRRNNLSLAPFHKLLNAFRQDLTKTEYATWEELRRYTSLSADPVGHLVLELHGIRDTKSMELSDHICSALQVVNHLQDVGEDYQRGRIYLPREDMEKFGVSRRMIADKSNATAFRRLIAFEADRSQNFFLAGFPLIKQANGSLSAQLALYWGGGMAVLRALRRIDYDVLNCSAKLTRWEKAQVVVKALRRLVS